MKHYKVLLLALSFGLIVRGQKIEGLYDSTARDLRNGCVDNACFWTVEHLLTYYGVTLDKDGLRKGLQDSRPDVRSMAAEKLGNDGMKDAIPWLAAALSSERIPGTRSYIGKALADLGDSRGFAVLEGMCRSSGEADVSVDAILRLRAASFIRDLHKNTCNAGIIDLLRSLDQPATPAGYLRTAALGTANVLQLLNEDQIATVRGVAERWISDEDESLRRQAGRAIALYGDAASYERLKTAHDNERDATVRAAMEKQMRLTQARLRGTATP